MSEQPASEEQQQQQWVQAVYEFAAEQLKNGVAEEQVRGQLREKGLDEESAGIVVANLVKARAEAKREAGKKHMIYGALWAIGGTIVTAATYSAASGGGKYVVAWGAIVFGVIQFFYGLSQSGGSD